MRALPAALASIALVVSGCSSGVLVDSYAREPGTADLCDALVADLPAEVAGQDRREVAQDVPAGAWGEVPVVLRCGVPDPDALEPTSPCYEVEGVGWFEERGADGRVFTTIGRAANVSVEVPAPVQPAADVLVDLADVVTGNVPVEQPCV
ncbi:hypothetical protein GCM10009821_15010 [Aeromicrobium halocynthiae]|uniref:DUF3515 domain-containing protein n=1 Tax=Aeromicrobium halocynthiae TaxID=560557 RepID=A0ABN2VXP7_9ACTN